MRPLRPIGAAARWLALLVLPTLLFLAALEGVLRATGAEQAVARRVSERMYPLATLQGGANNPFATRMFDPVLGWRLRPHARLTRTEGVVNSLGFVGPEFEWRKPSGIQRVLSLGDSVTYGLWQCGPAGFFCHVNPYPVALELLWNRAGSRSLRAIDAGVYGYSSLQGLRYYRTYLGGLDADVVTVMFGWNDHGPRSGREAREPRSAALRAIAEGAARLATYRTLAGLFAWAGTSAAGVAPEDARGPLVPRVELDDFAAHLTRIVELARAREARVLLLTEPVGPPSATPETADAIRMLRAPSYEALVALHERYNERTRAVAARLGVPLVDAAAGFEARDKTALFSPYDIVHPNEVGHALIAQWIAERIVREGWVRPPGR